MKKRFKSLSLAIFLIIFLVFLGFWFLFLKDFAVRKLMNESNVVINKIENFRNERNRLPNSLTEIGIKETEYGPIFYEKRSELDYVIYFNIGFDDIRFYNSNNQKWTDSYHR